MKPVIDISYPFCPHHNQIQLGDNWERGKDAKHYLMWSGGTDSTLLLYELLDTYGADHVIAISYIYPWLLSDKASSEKIAREAIKAKLNTLGPKFANFSHTEITVSQEQKTGSFLQAIQGGGLPQAVAWLLSVPLFAEENSYIYDGGIRCDDLTLRLEDYHRLFTGVAGVMRKGLTLREPHLHYTKANVLERLIEYDLYDIAWYCEQPDGVMKPCRKCTPCITHIAALIELYLSPRVSEFVKQRALRELNKIQKDKGNSSSSIGSLDLIAIDNPVKCEEDDITI